jgi:exosortase
LNDTRAAVTNRWVLLGASFFFSSLFFVHSLIALVRVCLSNDDLSYLILIPFISAAILFVEHHKVLPPFFPDGTLGGGLLILAASAAVVSRFGGIASSRDLQLFGYILCLVLLWLAGFALLLGRAAFKACHFALLFLFLMIPPPAFLLNRLIHILQAGSAWITEVLFDLFGVPVLRDGFVFHLTRVTIEVAKECSGIRSSMALLILGLLIVHFGLHNLWTKAIFVVCAFLMMILKNGIRIVILTLLARYVDPGFLYGRLHRQGGVVFFLIGLLLLAPVYWLLRRSEGPELPAAEAP